MALPMPVSSAKLNLKFRRASMDDRYIGIYKGVFIGIASTTEVSNDFFLSVVFSVVTDLALSLLCATSFFAAWSAAI